MQAAFDVGEEFLLARRGALADQHGTDRHVGVSALVDQEGGIKRRQPVHVALRHLSPLFPISIFSSAPSPMRALRLPFGSGEPGELKAAIVEFEAKDSIVGEVGVAVEEDRHLPRAGLRAVPQLLRGRREEPGLGLYVTQPLGQRGRFAGGLGIACGFGQGLRRGQRRPLRAAQLPASAFLF